MTPYYEEDGITIYHGDAREILPHLRSVDHVITDPPYSEHVHANHKTGNTRKVKYGETRELGFEFLTPEVRAACARWFRFLTRRWILVFSDAEGCHFWREDLEATGLEYIRTGAWVKAAPIPQFSGDRPSAGFEPITIAHPRGRKRWNGHGGPALWVHQIVKGGVGEVEPRLHTAQKPIGLMLDLVGDFTDEGDTILDSFMGSGTTLVAAKKLNRNAIGIDVDEENCAKAVDRLELIARQQSFGARATQGKLIELTEGTQRNDFRNNNDGAA